MLMWELIFLKKKIFNNLKIEKISLESQILPLLAQREKIQSINFQSNFFLDIGIKSDLKKQNLCYQK